MKKKFYERKGLNRIKLILVMSSIVFSLVWISFIGLWLVYVILYEIPFIDVENLPRHTNTYIFLGMSLIIGIVLSVIFRKYVLKPLHEAYLALGKIADGNFDVSVDVIGIRAVRRVTKSVNLTAKELGSAEGIRNDFVNNFSHEFRTPIVSISGFAKQLKNPRLSPQEKEEYIDIIIGESERLSQLSANVLNLTRLSNQTILTGIREYDLAEQLRRVIILLENKWNEKNITVSLDSKEYTILANEEMLSQLWINLIDNAIKFSPLGSEIKIAVTKDGDSLRCTVADEGKGMDEETAKHAFDRFYQGDISHKSAGTGIGLAIAKRICELHSGDVRIKETNEKGSVFEVILPLEN